MEDEAELGFGVVGKGGTLVRVQGCVGFAGGDDGESAGGEEGAEADAEGQGDGLFRLAVGQSCTGISAAVGRIEHNHEMRCGRDGRGLRESWEGSEKERGNEGD